MDMLSGDKNIESIADFVEEAKVWITLKKEYTKLDIIEKVVRICTILVILFVFLLLTFTALTYLSFAAAYCLGGVLDSLPLAFCCVSLFYLLLLLIFYAKRRSWIERPLVKFLVSILLTDGKS